MKNLNILIFISLSCFWTSLTFGQSEIKYGSNNGKYVTILDKKIYYEEYGNGAPLILLQGGMGSIEDFSLCIPELSKHFRVIAPDTPGQGRSELADSMSYQLIAEYFSKMIDLLKLDSAYIMGWSDGGNAGLLLAESRSDKVKKVLAVGANYNIVDFLPPNTDMSMVNPPSESEFEAQNKEWIEN